MRLRHRFRDIVHCNDIGLQEPAAWVADLGELGKRASHLQGKVLTTGGVQAVS